MAGEELPVKIIDEIQRLVSLKMTDRAIARALRVDRRSVKKYRLQEGEPPKGATLLPHRSGVPGGTPFWTEVVDWKDVIAEVKRGVPLNVIFEEHKEAGKLPVQYPGFWKQLRKRAPNLDLTIARVFAPGERAEIDYCDGIDLLDPVTGDIISTQLFVGVLCHSRFAFAEFTLSQKVQDFLSSHVRMLAFFGGVPQVVAPDNLKSAVTKAHRYDPIVNPAYTRLAEHYRFAVVPARVAKPRDKAIVERTIQIFQRWFYFRVRKKTFSSLAELNRSLREHLEIFLGKRHRIFRCSRREMYENEKSHLIPLPERAYEVATHKTATPHPDCHAAFDENFYSVPHLLRGMSVDIWATANVVEIYHKGERVAFHGRSHRHGKFVTNPDHYPEAQRAYYEVTPSYLRGRAAKLGAETSKLIHQLLSGPFLLQEIRRCQGIIRLSDKYGKERLEMAIEKAVAQNQIHCQAIERLIKNEALWSHKRDETPINRGSNQHLRGEELWSSNLEKEENCDDRTNAPCLVGP